MRTRRCPRRVRSNQNLQRTRKRRKEIRCSLVNDFHCLLSRRDSSAVNQISNMTKGGTLKWQKDIEARLREPEKNKAAAEANSPSSETVLTDGSFNKGNKAPAWAAEA